MYVVTVTYHPDRYSQAAMFRALKARTVEVGFNFDNGRRELVFFKRSKAPLQDIKQRAKKLPGVRSSRIETSLW